MPLAAVLELKNITKRFPGVVANDKINLAIVEGEIHALLGENGAGKTTLMNIVCGLYSADEGDIYFQGQKVGFRSAKAAIDAGIGMIHQHFMLVPVHTVTENIIMGLKPERGIRIDYRKAEEKIRALSQKYNLTVDPKAKIYELSVGAQQRVEIIKVLFRQAKILIMDEPTAVLTPQEVKELFSILRNLQKQGLSVILITHKLSEVMEVADRVTVLRDGRVIKTLNARETNEQELARLMVGRDVSFVPEKTDQLPGETVLQVNDLYAQGGRGVPALQGISFTVHAGEILGVAGVDGNGQSELAEVLVGLRKCSQGTILLCGTDVTRWSTRRITVSGVAHIPEDRRKRGLVLDFSVAENCILQTYFQPPVVRRHLLQKGCICQLADDMIQDFNIKTPSRETPVKNLSGGNQQKVVVARELSRCPRLLIAVQPTRGVDIGAIENIHRHLLRERERGAAILLISTELSEIMALSDRIMVMYKGRIMGEMDAKQANINQLGLWMAGIGGQGGGMHIEQTVV